MCLCPIYVPNLSMAAHDYARHGKMDQCVIDHYLDNHSAFIAVPCRKCLECLKARSAEWSARLRTELDYEINVLGHDCYFVTLTISPEFLHLFTSFGKVDPSKCSKLLGSFFRSLKDSYRCSFRHFCIAEYGERRGRLHFHCLFFNPPASLETDGVHLHYSKNGVRMGSSPVLRRFWKYGFNDSGKVKSVGAGCYVSKYLMKDIKSVNNLPPILVSRNVGKNALSIERSKDVLRKCLASGYFTIPVVYGRSQKNYQIPYSWMKKHYLYELASEVGYSIAVADLIIRYAMSEYYNSGRDVFDTPVNRRTRLMNIIGDIPSPLSERTRLDTVFIDNIQSYVNSGDFYYDLELNPY